MNFKEIIPHLSCFKCGGEIQINFGTCDMINCPGYGKEFIRCADPNCILGSFGCQEFSACPKNWKLNGDYDPWLSENLNQISFIGPDNTIFKPINHKSFREAMIQLWQFFKLTLNNIGKM